MVNGDAVVESLEDPEDARPLLTRIRPDPPEGGAVDALGTAFRQIRARASAAHDALGHSPQARPPGEVKEDDRVRPVEAGIPAAVRLRQEVAVEDPAISAYRHGEPLARLVSRRRRPTGTPEERVEM